MCCFWFCRLFVSKLDVWVCVCLCCKLIVVCIGVWPLASYGHSKVFFRAVLVVAVIVAVVVVIVECERRKQPSHLALLE